MPSSALFSLCDTHSISLLHCPLDSSHCFTGSTPSRAVTGNLEEVVALTLMHSNSTAHPLLLAVAHASGDIHVFDAATATWLSHFRAQPNINALVAAEK